MPSARIATNARYITQIALNISMARKSVAMRSTATNVSSAKPIACKYDEFFSSEIAVLSTAGRLVRKAIGNATRQK